MKIGDRIRLTGQINNDATPIGSTGIIEDIGPDGTTLVRLDAPVDGVDDYWTDMDWLEGNIERVLENKEQLLIPES